MPKHFLKVASVLLIVAALLVPFMPRKAEASLAGIWQFPLDRPWNIDPEFQYGSPWGGAYHMAEDVEAPAGTEVHAAANGVVRKLVNFQGYQEYGGVALIEHQSVTGSKNVSLYGHLDPYRFKVKVGQIVNRGDVIGYLGSREINGGWKTHLHFGIRKGAYTSQWIYYGFGDANALKQWEKASEYVPARSYVKEVARLPLYSRDRYETAVGASQWRFPANDSAAAAIVASGESYAGAIAATPLSTASNMPLLLSRSGSLPSSTERELLRVLPSGGAVYLVGNQSVVSDAVKNRIEGLGFTVARVTGANNEATAVSIAGLLPESEMALLVSSGSFADGISAGAPAATLRVPILLSSSAGLSEETRAYLAAHNDIERIIMIGGPAALSTQVEADLQALGVTVERVSGADRYATNRAAMEKYFNQPKVLVMATGNNFPDALAGGALAASQQGALILSDPAGLRAGVGDYIHTVKNSVGLGLVLGGPAAISTSVDVAVGSILNAALGLTTTSTTTYESYYPDWKAAHTKTVAGLTLPVPAGCQIIKEQHKGAAVLSVYPGETGIESTAVLSVATLKRVSGQSAHETVAGWLRLKTADLDVTSVTPDGIIMVRSSPGLVPRTIGYMVRADDVLLFDVRSDSEAMSLLSQLATLNR
jgi:putative cell wall-binding protein